MTALSRHLELLAVAGFEKAVLTCIAADCRGAELSIAQMFPNTYY
jgi:hypothetical protein